MFVPLINPQCCSVLPASPCFGSQKATSPTARGGRKIGGENQERQAIIYPRTTKLAAAILTTYLQHPYHLFSVVVPTARQLDWKDQKKEGKTMCEHLLGDKRVVV
jgi:hypothetical protein